MLSGMRTHTPFTDGNWTLPYPSLRQPVLAGNVVATSQPLAAQAGLDALRRGGNAVDAAIAAAVALTVVEPTSNGIGSDAQAIVWTGRELAALNGSGRSPRRMTLERYTAGGRTAMPLRGWDPVTVPGAVSAWVELHGRYGRLPFASLFDAGIAYARDGFLVSPVTARAWERSSQDAALASAPGFAHAFLPGGRAPRPGERFRCLEQAATLEDIAATGGESFYRGALAAKMAAFARATGGLLDEEDLARHAPRWVDVLRQEFCGVELCELPPNLQGIAALIALGIARELGVEREAVDSPDWLHLSIEAMKLAFADVHAHVCDPAAAAIPPEALLDRAYLARRAALVRRDRALPPERLMTGLGGTVYLTTADASGMMVSFIQSNFHGFGSGVVVPGTGISLQNRGHGFSLVAGHPNAAAGGKLPFHTIIPGMVLEQGRARMAFGVMGGSMQAQGHLQMLLRIFGAGQSPQAASDAPRWRVESEGRLFLEHGFPEAAAAELARRGHPIQSEGAAGFGGAQLIYRLDAGGYVAASDHRKDGQAVGY
jgi:gamma-glutamyltranspeptidase/glutathione hydrolase